MLPRVLPRIVGGVARMVAIEIGPMLNRPGMGFESAGHTAVSGWYRPSGVGLRQELLPGLGFDDGI